MDGKGIGRSLMAALVIVAHTPSAAQDESDVTRRAEALNTPLVEGPADPAPDRGVTFDPAILAQMCSPRGAFQFTFGQHGIPASSRAERQIMAGLALPEEAAPFVEAKPGSTKWSDQFYAIDFTFRSDESDAMLEDLYLDLDAQLTADGWLRRPEGYDAPIYKLAYAGDYSWYKVDGTGADAPEIMLDLSEFAGEVTLACARSDLALRAVEEELGQLPEGTARPAEPQIPMVAVPREADCARPEIAAEIDAFLEDGSPNAYLRALIARGDYQDRLSQWMMWRLEQAGASDDEVFRLAMEAAGMNGGPEGIEASLAAIFGLFPLAEKLDAAKRAGDRDAVCQAFVEITGIYHRVAANSAAQTRALEAIYRREAPRYGLDPEQ